jgi:hypothetical protein
VIFFDGYYASYSLECLADWQIVPEEVEDLGVTLKACSQAGRQPRLCLGDRELVVPFQYYQLQS